MPIDPTIALNAYAPKPINPFEMAQQQTGLMGNMLQLKAQQQQIGANQAQSNAIRAATDPTSGQIDYDKATSLLAQDPNGAYNAPAFAKTIQEMRTSKLGNEKTGIEIDQGKFQLLTQRQDRIGQQLGGLLQHPGLGQADMTNDVMNSVGSLVQQGILPLDQAKQVLSQWPQGNPVAQAQMIKQLWMQHQKGADQLKAMQPNMQTINTGGQQVVQGFDPMTGKPLPSASAVFNNTMTPGDANSLVPVYDPARGGMVNMTKQQVAAMANGQGGGAGGGLMASAPIGSEEATKGAVQRFNAGQEGAAQARTAMNGYDRALKALTATTSGPGSKTGMNIAGIMQSIGLPVASDMTSNYQELHKYLANAAASAAASAGFSGSDSRMAAFASGQPNAETMNPKALEGAIKFVKGLSSAAVARQDAAAKFLANNGGNYSALPQFENAWAKSMNPDVFEMRSSTPEQAKAFVASLPPERRAALKRDYQALAALGAF